MVSNNYSGNDWLQKMTLYNEDGTNLQEFGDRYTADAIKVSDSAFKLIVSQDKSGENLYDIYAVSGFLSAEQQEMLTVGSKVYPNPATNRINITNSLPAGENGTVQIYTLGGAKVLEQAVSGNNPTIALDIESLSSGTYVYKLNNRAEKFIKK
ncbi:T9SS type A sorting domain-containing protein [Flavobacterium sp. 3HN19-14]|uniref:T9SS type A sorting domain-containing protein n=1 Tax=Flavobacterium sp. 3HN19-14 TaxID=3448133 RepID=UPI003EE225FC